MNPLAELESSARNYVANLPLGNEAAAKSLEVAKTTVQRIRKNGPMGARVLNKVLAHMIRHGAMTMPDDRIVKGAKQGTKNGNRSAA